MAINNITRHLYFYFKKYNAGSQCQYYENLNCAKDKYSDVVPIISLTLMHSYLTHIL